MFLAFYSILVFLSMDPQHTDPSPVINGTVRINRATASLAPLNVDTIEGGDEEMTPHSQSKHFLPDDFSPLGVVGKQSEVKDKEDDSGDSEAEDFDYDDYYDDNYDDNDSDDDAEVEDEKPRPISYIDFLRSDPTFRKSAYEIRWPGHRQHRWNKKVTQAGQELIPEGQHICYVHVGKAGGSTLGCALGFSLHCGHGGGSSLLPGTLPVLATHMMHSDVNDCPDNMPNYLFNLRNPVHRVQSAYVYDREKEDSSGKHLYVDCPFWTLQDLVNRGLDANGSASVRCKHRAFKAIRGTGYYADHLYYNYEYYWESIDGDNAKNILVVRTEHMAQDWNSIEDILSHELHASVSTVATRKDFGFKNVGTKTNADVALPDSSRLLLCKSLCREIQVYKLILRRANNLSENDVTESLNELHETCPKQALTETCT